MSKRMATRWYIGAWLIAVSCMVLLLWTGRGPATRPSTVIEVVLAASGIVMFATWIAALIQLAQRRAWRWFACVLLIYLVSLGLAAVVPMLAYAMAGPGGEPAFVAVRPSTT